MDLRTTAHEYVDGTNKMTEEFKKMCGEMVLEETFKPEHLALLQSMFGMIEVSTRLVQQQANTIQEINEKMDKLLAKRKD